MQSLQRLITDHSSATTTQTTMLSKHKSPTARGLDLWQTKRVSANR